MATKFPVCTSRSDVPRRRSLSFEALDARQLLTATSLATEFTATAHGATSIVDTTDAHLAGLPAALAEDELKSTSSSQEILVADRLTNSVYRYSTSGSFLGILIDHDNTHLSQPSGVQVSPDGTKLYVASSQTNSVVVYDYDYGAATATYSQTITQNLNFPSAILFNAAGTKFYVANFAFNIVEGNPVPVGVSQFNADGTSAGPNLVGGSILQASGLAWAADNELLVTGFNGLIAKSTGGVSALADYIGPTPALTGASGILRVGNSLYVSAMFVPAVYKYDISGAPSQVGSFTINSLPFPQDILPAPDGNGLLVGVLGDINGTGNISRIGLNGALDPITVFAASGDGVTAFQEATAIVVASAPANSSTVTGRRIFYNNSFFDNPGGVNNASAIAPDKTAYIPTGTTPFAPANVTSFSKGINGIMVELTGTSSSVTAADFQVKMSGQNLAANNAPSTWTAAPTFTVTAVPNVPASGTTRYELIWADGAIVNRYVQVTTLATANTGLSAPDTFYFGNKIGDNFIGFTSTFSTNASDGTAARNNQAVLVGITSVHDFDKNNFVNATDEVTSRNNQGILVAVTIGNPPAAPEGDDGSGGAVASALAASVEPSSEPMPRAVSHDEVGKYDGGGSARAALSVELLVEPVREPVVVAGGNALVVDLALDDELLESLVDE